MKNNLLKDLTQRIKNAKKEETSEDVVKREFINFLIKSRERVGENVKHFYFDDKQYYDVLAMYKFLKVHSTITTDEIRAVLRMKNFKLDFLRKLLNMFPNLIDDLYFGGPLHVEIMYAKEMQRLDKIKKEREEYRKQMYLRERFKY